MYPIRNTIWWPLVRRCVVGGLGAGARRNSLLTVQTTKLKFAKGIHLGKHLKRFTWARNRVSCCAVQSKSGQKVCTYVTSILYFLANLTFDSFFFFFFQGQHKPLHFFFFFHLAGDFAFSQWRRLDRGGAGPCSSGGDENAERFAGRKCWDGGEALLQTWRYPESGRCHDGVRLSSSTTVITNFACPYSTECCLLCALGLVVDAWSGLVGVFGPWAFYQGFLFCFCLGRAVEVHPPRWQWEPVKKCHRQLLC